LSKCIVKVLKIFLAAIVAIGFTSTVVWMVRELTTHAAEREEANREQRQQNFAKFIEKCLDKANLGQIDAAVDELVAVDPGHYSMPLQCQWYTALGDIFTLYLDKMSRSLGKSKLLAARRFYEIALEKAPDQPTTTAINIKLASLFMKAQMWPDAEQILNNQLTLLLAPETRRQVLMLLAQCRQQQRDFAGALQYLQTVVEDSPESVYWSQAVLTKSLLLQQFIGQKTIPEGVGAADSDELYQQINALYQRLEEQLGGNDPRRFQAMLGRLQLAVERGDAEQAYLIEGQIREQTNNIEAHIKALQLIARLENERNQPVEALRVLQFCRDMCTDTSWEAAVLWQLYELQAQFQNWDDAFRVAQRLGTVLDTAQESRRLLNDLLPGGKLLEHLDMQGDGNAHAQAQQLLQLLAGKAADPYLSTIVNYASALLSYNSGQYREAETQLMQLLQMFLMPDLREQVQYYLLKCAQQLNRHQLVRLLRAQQYLTLFPDGIYARQALAVMLDGYYELQFHSQALEIARKAFVSELMRMNDRENATGVLDPLLQHAIIRVTQCYQRLGQYSDATRLLRRYDQMLLSEKLANDLYLDYVQSAALSGQTAEAIRRIDVVLRNIDDAELAQTLALVRLNLLFVNSPDHAAIVSTRHLDRLKEQGQALTPLQQQWRWQLYDKLLAHSYTAAPENVQALLADALNLNDSALWLSGWAARTLQLATTPEQLAATRDILRDNVLAKLSTDPHAESVLELLRLQLGTVDAINGLETRIEQLKQRGLN